ncbi:hypothetical protein TNCV_311331 [Trichonephila clavipes]|nr:hypothetical protein TNCV_311331 [Trichonephila clavipes]
MVGADIGFEGRRLHITRGLVIAVRHWDEMLDRLFKKGDAVDLDIVFTEANMHRVDNSRRNTNYSELLVSFIYHEDFGFNTDIHS